MSSFSVREEPGGLILRLEDPSGLNDFRSNAVRSSLYETVETISTPRIAVDLGPIDYLSSSGVAILVGIQRRGTAQGGKVVFFHIQPNVLDLLRSMKLDQYFQFADDESCAMAALRSLPTA
ncbi:STAS domain-containing protein [Singulisphaera rosea]